MGMAKKENNGARILLVLYYYHPYVSGVSVAAKRTAEGLVKRGYEVTVLTSRFDRKLPKQEIINRVKIIRRPVLLKLGKGVIMPTFWLDIIRYSRRNDYLNPNLPMTESGLASLFIPKRKIVTTYQCDIFLGHSAVDKLITFISMKLMSLQLMRSGVVVPSTIDYLKNSKMKRFLNKAQEINPPVPVNEFYPVEHSSLYKKMGIEKSDIKIGFVGRIVYEKGINYLLAAIPHIAEKVPDFKIILVGDYQKVAGGSIKDQLDNYIRLYPGKIIFTGFLNDEDRNRFYSGLDVFVLPSIDPLEAFGMVQIEAMLCGAPVVASNLPGVREIVRKTGYGKISKVKDPEDIAKQVIEVVQHPMKYMPDREKVISLYSAGKSVDTYANLMPARVSLNKAEGYR
jgi:glycosyltransferase involved in cell wall biosynthesis